MNTQVNRITILLQQQQQQQSLSPKLNYKSFNLINIFTWNNNWDIYNDNKNKIGSQLFSP